MICVAALTGCVATTETGTLPGPANSVCDVGLDAALSATVRVDTGEGRFASGVVIDTDRVVTAAHSVDPDAKPWVEVAGMQWPSSVLAYDHGLDIAILEPPTGGVEPLRINKGPIDPGLRVLMVGHPGGGERQFLPASVQSVAGQRIYLDTPVSEGYSGGAIMHCLDSDWVVAGVILGYIDNENSVTTEGTTVGIAATAIMK